MDHRRPDQARPPRIEAGAARRWLFLSFGVLSFSLGAVGALVPGMPTTVFVIIGSFFLTKSCPWLADRLTQMKLFRPYAGYLDPTVPMPLRAKACAIGAMWTAIGISSAGLLLAGASAPVVGVIAAAGAVGTFCIARFRRAAAIAARAGPGPIAGPDANAEGAARPLRRAA